MAPSNQAIPTVFPSPVRLHVSVADVPFLTSLSVTVTSVVDFTISYLATWRDLMKPTANQVLSNPCDGIDPRPDRFKLYKYVP